MSGRKLPYGRQWITEDDLRLVTETLLGDQVTTGPMVERFEAALRATTGARYALTVNSGTAALHTAYFAAGLDAGDEIITTPLTFAATANAARYLGAHVVFVDIQPDTGNLDPTRLEEAITARTKLVVPVDFAGHPADYDEIRAIATRHGLTVVADAAHALGASYRARPVGLLADLTTVSFHPVKPVTTAEGGAILTDDPCCAERAVAFRTHGMTHDPARMTANEGPWYYEMHDLGYNYRLNDLQCALGVSQLTRLAAFLTRRQAIARRYTEALRDLPAIILPTERTYVASGWHLYVLRVAGDPARRLPLFERLRELGLGVQVHYIPVYYHPYYQQLGYQKGLCPHAEDFYDRAISLPIFPRMTEEEVEQVIALVRRAVADML